VRYAETADLAVEQSEFRPVQERDSPDRV